MRGTTEIFEDVTVVLVGLKENFTEAGSLGGELVV